MEDQYDCQNWKSLFNEVEQTKHNLRFSIQCPSIQLSSIINEIKLNNNNKHTLLLQKKEKLKNSQKHQKKNDNIIDRSTYRPKTQLNELHQCQEMESTRLIEQLRHTEFAMLQQRSKNQQLTETLSLYNNNQTQMFNVTKKLNHEKQMIINERTDILRQIQNGKTIQQEVVNKLKRTLEKQEEQCILQMQQSGSNQHVIKLQQPIFNSTILQEEFVNQTLVEIVQNSKQLIQMRQCSKLEVKQILKCFYVLSKLSLTTMKEKFDYANIDIIEKEKARMYSKEELIAYFQENNFIIDKAFEQKICNRYNMLKNELKNLETQYNLQQELIKEKEHKLKELEAAYTQQSRELERLEGLKREEQQLKLWDIENSHNEGLSIYYCQFYYSFMARLFRISNCIQLVTDEFVIYNPSEKVISRLNEEWSKNELIQRYGQLISMNQFVKVEGWSNAFKDSPQLLAILKTSRLIKLLAQWQASSSSFKEQTPMILFGELINKSHQLTKQLANMLTHSYRQLNQILRQGIVSKRKFRTQLKENFRDAYCIESPEFYCRDNMKLIEKIQAMKLKNMGARRQLPSESELNQYISENRKDKPAFTTIRKRHLKHQSISKQQPNTDPANTIPIRKRLECNFTEQNENTTSPFPYSNMFSDRRHAEQSSNMSVRNMLSIVKKIGTLDITRAKTNRKRNNFA